MTNKDVLQEYNSIHHINILNYIHNVHIDNTSILYVLFCIVSLKAGRYEAGVCVRFFQKFACDRSAFLVRLSFIKNAQIQIVDSKDVQELKPLKIYMIKMTYLRSTLPERVETI